MNTIKAGTPIIANKSEEELIGVYVGPTPQGTHVIHAVVDEFEGPINIEVREVSVYSNPVSKYKEWTYDDIPLGLHIKKKNKSFIAKVVAIDLTGVFVNIYSDKTPDSIIVDCPIMFFISYKQLLSDYVYVQGNRSMPALPCGALK